MRERHQRPRVQDCGVKWRICYWDYRSTKRSGRTKCWAKSLVPTRTEAQRLADGFMETVNQRNNEPQLFPGGEETLAGLVAIFREKMWPLLKNSTRISYDYHLDTYILPKWGSRNLTKLRTIELQDSFNSFSPRLASKTIRNGVRPEVTRDNMGHANVDVTQNVYNRTWWEERVEAVSMAAATVWREFLAQPVPATRM